MHSRLIVLLEKKDAKCPNEAIVMAKKFLDERYFAQQNESELDEMPLKIFATPPADYYEIGGRFSGNLVEKKEYKVDAEIDAKIVNEQIWDNMLSKMEAYDTPHLYEGNCYASKEFKTFTKNEVVNKKWAVVVDFHH